MTKLGGGAGGPVHNFAKHRPLQSFAAGPAGLWAELIQSPGSLTGTAARSNALPKQLCIGKALPSGSLATLRLALQRPGVPGKATYVTAP